MKLGLLGGLRWWFGRRFRFGFGRDLEELGVHFGIRNRVRFEVRD